MAGENAPSKRFVPEQTSVLVVDDQPFFRALLTEILRSIGVRSIFTAANGEEGIEDIRSFRPDVVLADWMMPDMDGLEMTRAIRRSRILPNRAVPIILVTSNNRRSQVESALQAGVDEILVKPVTLRGVFERMKKSIENPRPFIDTPVYTGPCRRRVQRSDYLGPRRRTNDPLEVVETSEDAMALRDMMTVALHRIRGFAAQLREGRTIVARPIYMATLEVQAVAAELDDKEMLRAAISLIRYLDAVGRTPDLAADVVETHLAAIERLMVTPQAEQETRHHVALGLEQIVAKRLRTSAA